MLQAISGWPRALEWAPVVGGSATGAHTGCTIRTSSKNQLVPPFATGAGTGARRVAAHMSQPRGNVALVYWNGGSPVSRMKCMRSLRSTYWSGMNHDGVYGFDTFLKSVVSQVLVHLAKQYVAYQCRHKLQRRH